MLNLVLAEKTFACELQAKSAVKEFVKHLDSLAEKWDGSNYYVASTSLVQSSGFGKSRTATAAAEYGAYVLYLNFVHGDAFAYPRLTPLNVTNFFMDCDIHKKALAPVAERKPVAEWSSRAKSSIIFDPLFELNLFDALAKFSVASLLTGLFGDAHVNRIRATLGNQPRVMALLDQGLASFTHWVKVEYQVQPHHLVALFMRSAAILCKTNEKGVDLIIPVVMPNDQGEHELKPSAMTFILVQVKNYAKHAASARALTARKRSARLDALECGISWFPTLPYLSVYMAVRNLESGKSTFEIYSTPPRTSSPTADDLCHDVLVEMRGTDTKGQPINVVVGGDDQGVVSLSADQKRVVHDVHQALFGSTADAELASALSTTPGLGVGLSVDGEHSDPSMDHGHDDLATSSESSTNRAASWSDTGLRIYSMLQFTHLAVADNKSASYGPFIGALRAVVRTHQQVAIAAVGLNGDLYAVLDAKKRTEDALSVSVLHTALQDFLKGELESKEYSDKRANMVIPLVEKAFNLVLARQLPPSILPNELRPRPRDDKDADRDDEVGEAAEGQSEDRDGDVVMTDL
ncbi:hypothetical protein GGF32_006192 [Allomyces javanicus]|nr:hypothetical protein GGF32_006192 [Allomyces javanicus]